MMLGACVAMSYMQGVSGKKCQNCCVGMAHCESMIIELGKLVMHRAAC